MRSDGHGLVPSIYELQFEGEAFLDGEMDALTDAFAASKVGIVDCPECGFVPLAHGVGDHVEGSDEALGGS